MEDSLMTAAETKTDAATVDQAGTANADVGNSSAPADGQPAVDAAPAGDSDRDAGPLGAPEKYEFARTDGQTFDPAVIEAFSTVAKELNLTQDAAQSVLAKVAPVIQRRQAEQMQEIRLAWATDSQSDKEFGGDKLAENLSVAKKALDAFGTPAFIGLLNESGLGNHPELIRMLWRAGKAISEDGFVGGSGAGARPVPHDFSSQATALYANQNK